MDEVDALLAALSERAEEMARRGVDVYRAAFPGSTEGWATVDELAFLDQSKQRFETIVAITRLGLDGDVGDLEVVGAGAAWSKESLPQLLMVLRISRDLVVQTAVELAVERGPYWGGALAVVIARLLAAIDQLTDAVARGYWQVMVAQKDESRARHESVVEHSADGVYELGADGCIEYANPSLAAIVGRQRSELLGVNIAEVLVPAGDSHDIDELAGAEEPCRVVLTIVRDDGDRRELDILAIPRREGELVAGQEGIVRDLTVRR
jgi:PAS domain S-box-containing protein